MNETTATHGMEYQVAPEDLCPAAAKAARWLQNLTPGRYCVIIRHNDITLDSQPIAESEHKLLFRLRQLKTGNYLIAVQINENEPQAITIWAGGQIEKF